VDKRLIMKDTQSLEELLRMYSPPPMLESVGTLSDGGRLSPEKLKQAVEQMRAGRPVQDPILEAIILRFERPAYLITDNTFQIGSAPSSSPLVDQQVERAKSILETAIPKVGRIDLRQNSKPWVGTAWVVAPNIVVTNRHVAQAFASSSGGQFRFHVDAFDRKTEARVDFRREHQKTESEAFPVKEVLWIEPDTSDHHDVAFLRVDGVGDNGVRGRIPFLNSEAYADLEEEAWIAVIGYPALSPYNDFQDQERIFQGVYNVKRLQPGQVTNKTQRLLSHDCTTLGGNSGSVVLSLAREVAVALHFGGIEGDTNSAVPAPVVARLLEQHGTKRRTFPSPLATRETEGDVIGLRCPSPGEKITVQVPLVLHFQFTGGARVEASEPVVYVDPDRNRQRTGEVFSPVSVCATRLPRPVADIRRAYQRPEQRHSGNEGAAYVPILWDVGQRLRVKFLDGSPYMREVVKQQATTWEEYANIRFDFGEHPQGSEIRVSFEHMNGEGQPDGYWSLLGRFAERAAPNELTMSLSNNWDDRFMEEHFGRVKRTVLHEFGHALGLIHEHQSPTSDIPWNKPVVYAYYKASQGWSRVDVDAQVLNRNSGEDFRATSHDKDSIMQYPVPNLLTVGEYQVGWNDDLSQRDKEFVGQLYPFE
jgi:V8-like Glu-specific endopeptidase